MEGNNNRLFFFTLIDEYWKGKALEWGESGDITIERSGNLPIIKPLLELNNSWEPLFIPLGKH